jgi:hypothetical protein
MLAQAVPADQGNVDIALAGPSLVHVDPLPEKAQTLQGCTFSRTFSVTQTE